VEKILLQQEKGDFQKSKDLLVRKATELFYRYGYTKTPIRKIPENLKVKNTIIYCYFRNKDGRLFSIIDEIMDEMILDLENVIRCFPDSTESACATTERRKLKFLWRTPTNCLPKNSKEFGTKSGRFTIYTPINFPC